MIWLREALAFAERNIPFVLVSVIEIIGSAPREVGARMVVTATESTDSIGGGKLEYEATRYARQMLNGDCSKVRSIKFFGLGEMMNQCCGGAVRVLFESYQDQSLRHFYRKLYPPGRKRIEFLASELSENGATLVLSTKDDWKVVPNAVTKSAQMLMQTSEPSSILLNPDNEEWFLTRIDDKPTKVVIFGAGHVGKALVKLLQDLPFQIEWVDSRENIFPKDVPENTVAHKIVDFDEFIRNQSAGVFYVVMTHSHGLDYDVCMTILRKVNFGWLGLIGSKTKAKRFKKRMASDGIDEFTLNRLICPIGIQSVRGKFPAVIATSTSAQLLQERQKTMSESFQPQRDVVKPVQSTTA